MSDTERIVKALLEDEAEEFMRNVDFQGDKLVTLHDMPLIKEELRTFTSSVIRRTAQIMPELVKRGIVRDDQAALVAKQITFYLADHAYNPKHWHEMWQRNYRKMVRFLSGNVGWAGSLSRLD